MSTNIIVLSPNLLSLLSFREMEFAQREDAEKKRLEEAEKAHLAEIQSLQVRVIICTHTHTSVHFTEFHGNCLEL